MSTEPPRLVEAGAQEQEDRFADIRAVLAGLTPRERMLVVAERLFADEGLAAVSVRGITAAAQVNLASLHYHFGSKEGLLEAIFEARAKPIADERMRRLAECAEAPGRPPLLEQLLFAFLHPALTLGLEPRFGGPAFARLRARLGSESEKVSRRILSKAFDESSKAFMAAMQAALPDLPRGEFAWRFHFLLGTMVYTMADSGRIQSLTGNACDPADGRAALDHLIPFLAAGFRAPSIVGSGAAP
ncbi:TetR/AcrR family transcriptional regulator [Aquabacter spiritensis]|uniref:TetR family transcriptional regulator n=1 Tax=Aquabacter spiritensis TaxID=933073 RepID=A0A4R3LRC3_9HYPH|nr:TetR/AcrR family transcriptional regulator [Aquabacter spiritensis]TCT02950.1 TetR family transcriptional regulator [Aquabacter spiritensis]